MISDEMIRLSKSVFPELRKGTHLSTDNCKLYQEIIENQEEMIRLYKSVGFDLIIKDGYMYLDGSDDSLVNKKRIQDEALFFFILFPWIIEEGGDPWKYIHERTPIRIGHLPHLKTPANIDLMKRLELNDQDKLLLIIKRLKVRGFLKPSMDSFKLLPPAKRFLELAEQFNLPNDDARGEEE
tara:strand:+ start:182 stop:727 length:546 start_codon:yes stop_codon:yes gene_type:complete